jgi:threonine/homoserine/homoserine lactone efflux protein
MGDLILNVMPYALAAAAAAPVVAVVTAVILAQSRRPLLSAWVFTAGAAALVIVFAVVALAIAGGSGAFDNGNSEAGAIVDLVLGAVFLALGILAIFSSEDEEKENAQREQVQRVATAGLGGMLVAGVVAQVINVDALAVFTGALKEIAEADVSIGEGAVAVLVALAVMLLPYYGPAVFYAVSPARSGKVLRRMSEWLLGHSRGLEIVVGLGFGAVFLGKGISTI